jgi:glycosyltransferase involved in cell wall biosynthesis
VLTTRTNGAHELLTEGREGSILPAPEDTAAWTAALDRWLDRTRLEPASRAARALAEQHSAASKMRQSLAMLERVLAEKRAATTRA